MDKAAVARLFAIAVMLLSCGIIVCGIACMEDKGIGMQTCSVCASETGELHIIITVWHLQLQHGATKEVRVTSDFVR